MSTANAKTINIGNQSNALSLDPHSLNESLQLNGTGNVCEPLVGRNIDLSLAPILVAAWSQPAPKIWRFELRKGIKFYGGTPFTADDVIFSFARATGDGSDIKSYTKDIKELSKVNDLVVETETKGTYFPKILRRNTSFYLLGWTSGTYDSHNALNALNGLMRCVADKGSGQFNLGAYCNPKVD